MQIKPNKRDKRRKSKPDRRDNRRDKRRPKWKDQEKEMEKWKRSPSFAFTLNTKLSLFIVFLNNFKRFTFFNSSQLPLFKFTPSIFHTISIDPVFVMTTDVVHELPFKTRLVNNGSDFVWQLVVLLDSTELSGSTMHLVPSIELDHLRASTKCSSLWIEYSINEVSP